MRNDEKQWGTIKNVWSKPWKSGCGTDGWTTNQPTREDSATQLLICEMLSFAIQGSPIKGIGIVWFFIRYPFPCGKAEETSLQHLKPTFLPGMRLNWLSDEVSRFRFLPSPVLLSLPVHQILQIHQIHLEFRNSRIQEFYWFYRFKNSIDSEIQEFYWFQN